MVFQWLKIMCPRRHRQCRLRTQALEDFVRTVKVAVQDGSGKPRLRYAQAKFDTGNPKNLMSPAFARKLGLILSTHDERVILEGFGNGRFTSIGKVLASFAYHGSPHPRFFDVEFEVSSIEERFDVVIGSVTIVENKLISMGQILDIGLTGFRTSLPTYSKDQVDDAERRQQERRAANQAQKDALSSTTAGSSTSRSQGSSTSTTSTQQTSSSSG